MKSIGISYTLPTISILSLVKKKKNPKLSEQYDKGKH